MGRTKNKKIIALSLLLCFGFCLVAGRVSRPAGVSAGSGYVTVLSGEEIQGGQCDGAYYANGNVSFSGDTAIFSTKNGETAKLVANTAILNYGDYGVEELFRFSSKIEIAALKNAETEETGTFSVCFGMKKLAATVGATDSFELRFTYGKTGRGADAVAIGAYAYTENGTEELIRLATVVNVAYNNAFLLNLDVSSSGEVSVGLYDWASGTAIREYPAVRISGDGRGFVGFYGAGYEEVFVSRTEVTAREYFVAQNGEVTETFTHDGVSCYNKNYLYTQSNASPLTPSRVYANDGALAIENGTSVQIDTKYEYSNYEMEMDIVYFQRRAEFTEGFSLSGKTDAEISANVVRPISCWFGIAFGMSSTALLVDSTPLYAKYLLIEGVPWGHQIQRWTEYTGPRYCLYDNNGSYNLLSLQSMKVDSAGGKGLNLWDQNFENDESFTLKFTVNDGVVALYLKLTEEADYGAPQFIYDMGNTPLGYVRIFSCGAFGLPAGGPGYVMAQNMVIDNLTFRNTDANAILLEDPGFRSNLRKKTDDYGYNTSPDEADLTYGFTVTDGGKKGCASSVSGGAGLLACTIALCFVPALKGRKRK